MVVYMNIEQQIIYSGVIYKILSAEQEFVIHPSAFGLLPVVKASLQKSFSCAFHIEDYHLILDEVALTDTNSEGERSDRTYGCKVAYNGVLLIADNLVKEYYFKGGKLACFSYQNVLELVFENGMLITTIDQSKAMLRIRKNLELGLRDLSKNRDLRCIRRFINSSFVGDYKPFLLDSMRIKYLKDMKQDYENSVQDLK
jgi:hypothetical protein